MRDLHHAFGYGNLRRQAGDPRAHLTRGGTLLGHPPFEPKHLVELGPMRVVVEHPAHRDRALLQATVSFLHRRRAGEVGAGVRLPRREGPYPYPKHSFSVEKHTEEGGCAVLIPHPV